MKNAVVISEFDPFHLGHAKLCDKIKKALGEDSCVASIMSGYFTQRGNAALYPPLYRAERAVRGGFDLVISMPSPFSFSSSEFFAGAGVDIAKKLGVFEYLAFGYDLELFDKLIEISKISSSENFLNTLKSAPKENSHYRNFTSAYRKVAGEMPKLCGNDVLAIEYLKNLSRGDIAPLPIKRERDGLSASIAREAIIANSPGIEKLCGYQPVPYVKSKAFDLIFELCRAVPSIFTDTRAYLSPGMAKHFISKAKEAKNFDTFFDSLGKKTYSSSRLRRALLCSALAVNQDDISTDCEQVSVWAYNDKGRTLLREISKRSEINISSSPGVPENDIEERARMLYYAGQGISISEMLPQKPIYIH